MGVRYPIRWGPGLAFRVAMSDTPRSCRPRQGREPTTEPCNWHPCAGPYAETLGVGSSRQGELSGWMSQSFCRSRMRGSVLSSIKASTNSTPGPWIGDGRLLQAELRDDEGCSRGRANWLDVGPSQSTMDTRRSVRGGHIREAPKLSTSGHHRFRRSRQGPPAHRRRVGDVIWVVHVPWQ
jgi:hypothetical protein